MHKEQALDIESLFNYYICVNWLTRVLLQLTAFDNYAASNVEA